MRVISTWSLVVLGLVGCAQQEPQQATTSSPGLTTTDGTKACIQIGEASWYRGSSRDRASSHDLVAAHRSLPFGTPVLVTDIDTGQSVVVRINDRGPYGRGRIIDLSRAAADLLGIRRDGVARVRLEPVDWRGGGCPLWQAQAD